MQKWASVETKLPHYRTQKEKEKFFMRIKLVAIAFTIGAIIDHLLTAIQNIFQNLECRPNDDQLEAFLQAQSPQMFVFIEFSIWKGVLCKIINVVGSIAWNYTNLFVMIVSLGLSYRFKQFNDELCDVKGEVFFA